MANVTFKGNPVTLKGKELTVGDQISDFKVLDTNLEEVRLSDFSGKKKLISVIPSIDTGVCSTQTKTFNERAAGVDNVEVLTISNDLPFAQKRWTADEGMENAITLSDYKDLSFGENTGVVMEELRLLARSVFILDEDNKVVYVEYVPEGTDHPDYDKAIEALESM